MTPLSGKLAVAAPTATVPEVTVPIVVAPCLTVNVTVPSPTVAVDGLFAVTLAERVTFGPPNAPLVLETVVVVLALFTVKLAVPLLVAWVVSAGNVAVMVCGLVPNFDGVTEAVQVAAFPPLGARVQVPKVSPASDELSVTVPVGLVWVPVSVSVTVTVAVPGWPTTTVPSDKLTLVVVLRLLTVNSFVSVAVPPPGVGLLTETLRGPVAAPAAMVTLVVI